MPDRPSMGNRRVLQASLGAFLLLAGLVLLWKEVLEDRLIPKRWGVVVEDSIYRSGQLHPALVEETLERYQIDVIVNMNRWHLEKPAQAVEEAVADALGLEKARYPMGGNGTGDPENYALAVAHVHRAAGNQSRVLVHCTAGAQRTGAVIALYRTLFQGWPVADAIDEMEQYDFDREEDVVLLEFLDTHVDYIARRLVEQGVLANLPEPLPVFQS